MFGVSPGTSSSICRTPSRTLSVLRYARRMLDEQILWPASECSIPYLNPVTLCCRTLSRRLCVISVTQCALFPLLSTANIGILSKMKAILLAVQNSSTIYFLTAGRMKKLWLLGSAGYQYTANVWTCCMLDRINHHLHYTLNLENYMISEKSKFSRWRGLFNYFLK